MHEEALLHKLFSNSCIKLDKRIHRCTLLLSATLAKSKRLSIANLGRELPSEAKVKHNIKRADRLFGNKTLHESREYYYRKIAKLLIGSNQNPIIVIDWSGLTRCGEYHFIRASIPVGGRALTLLDSTYRECEYTSHKIHVEFINQLKEILPKGCKPIIVTDAGFRCPWFKLIESLGWDFVGRARHITLFRESGSHKWHSIKSLFSKVSNSARYLTSGELAKGNATQCHVYGIKKQAKNRIKKNLRGKKVQCSLSLRHAKREREPWLLVSSLSREKYNPMQIIAIYQKRMQIEEGFRDLKNSRNGLGFCHCRSFKTERLNIALLLSAIAILLLWILGEIAKLKNKHYLYQANTIKSRNVLSTIMIGWQYSKTIDKHIEKREIQQAVTTMREYQYVY
jgi:Transposase DDE domain